MPNVAVFLSYVFVTTFTPGPNNIMSMSYASRNGFKKTLPFIIGVCVGFLILMSLCNVFSVALYNIIPSIKPFMNIIGASYILFLAWKTFKSKPFNENNKDCGKKGYLTGVILQFVNPKAILYGITIASSFIVPYYTSISILGGFSIFLATITFVAVSSWALFGSLFQKLFAKHYKMINIIMSALLVYCAVSLFL